VPWPVEENPAAERMVRAQLESRDVYDRRVREVMARLPRHRFMSEASVGEAYGDYPVPIGHGQTISQPYIVAVMTQELRLGGSERALEIGTGSGYQTAVLASLCAEVCTIERIQALLDRSQALLADLGYRNIRFRLGDGTLGWPELAPYDRILVSAAADRVPERLTDQLSDNGILVAPIGDPDGYQRLVTIRRVGARLESTPGLGCRFVPLVAG
jgi:protein-L-isoaspartate(D-aspartate) O-methyltransferase